MPSDPYLGEITLSGINFAPRGYVLCQGQILPISSNAALFSILGTTYGGNGTTNFALPDLRGRVPVGFGQGPGLLNYVQGQFGGTESVVLTTAQIPAHAHSYQQNASSDPGDTASPGGAYPANTGALDKEYKTTLTNPVLMNGGNTGITGTSLPHPILQPYLALNYYMAVSGIYPTRN